MVDKKVDMWQLLIFMIVIQKSTQTEADKRHQRLSPRFYHSLVYHFFVPTGGTALEILKKPAGYVV
jgi:hypothetical protein